MNRTLRLTAVAVALAGSARLAHAQVAASDFAAYRDLQPLIARHAFSPASEGSLPSALVEGADGALYGAMEQGGAGGLGTVFRFAPDTGQFQVLHAFQGPLGGAAGADGGRPVALVFDTAGNLWGATSAGGPAGNGTVFRIAPGGAYSVVHAFTASTPDGVGDGSGASIIGVNADGVWPQSLTLGHDGYVYGITEFGGPGGEGTVFRIRPADGAFTRIYAFSRTTRTTTGPALPTDFHNADGGECEKAQLTVGGDGALYGMNSVGGPNGNGTVFRITTGGQYTRLAASGNGYTYIANQGGTPSAHFDTTRVRGIAAPDGAVWLSVGPRTTHLDDASVTLDGGNIVRIAPGGGALATPFVFPAPPTFPNNNQPIVYSPDNLRYGFWPTALSFAADGTLWGAASGGGLERGGALFRLQSDSASPTGFSPRGVYFPAGVGARPQQLLVGRDGNLYGIGGNTLFVARANPRPFLLHSFAGGLTDALLPNGILQGGDGNLYGTTYSNSAGIGKGTLFRLGVDSTPENDSFLFLNSLVNPNIDLLPHSDGKFYGSGQNGALYRLSAGGAAELLYGFDDVAKGTGSLPWGGLVSGNDGFFYGTTFSGGPKGFGVVYRLDPATHAVTVLHAFDLNGPAGNSPIGTLLRGSDGLLYGTTSRGGSISNSGLGTIFRLDPHAAPPDYGFQTLHQFDGGNNGGNSYGGLVERGGVLYGTFGANYFTPGVFRMNRDGSGYQVLANFASIDTGAIQAPLTLGADGNLYGLIDGGGNLVTDLTRPAFGGVFQVDANDSVQVLRWFHVVDGAGGYGLAGSPFLGRLFAAPDGALYGVAPGGGIATTIANGAVHNSAGTVFRLDIALPGAQPSGAIQNVTASVAVKVVSHVLVGGAHRYALQVSNKGATPLAGPIYLALDNLGTANQHLNADGYTHFALPANSPYGLVSAAALAPGAAKTITVTTAKPLTAAVTFRALAGPGAL